MQCQSPYVFINKDIYTRISICTIYIYMKRNLPTNDTSGSQSIASRVKGLGRAVKKKKKQPLDSPGSTQYK